MFMALNTQSLCNTLFFLLLGDKFIISIKLLINENKIYFTTDIVILN